MTDSSKKLTLVGHLEELRRRLIASLIAFVLTSAASLAWAREILGLLKRPAGDALPALAFFTPTEAILAYLRVAMTAGAILASPIWLFELWMFLSPALSIRERRFIVPSAGASLAMFLMGVAFGYFILLPVALPYLLKFGAPDLLPVISIGRYVSFVTFMLLLCGAAFELPVVIFALARFGFVRAEMLRAQRRFAVLGIFIASAVLTPTPDIVNQVLLAVPLLVLFEISIWVARFAEPRVEVISPAQ